MRRLFLALVAAALLVAAPAALATTETASSGSVSASFSYTKKSDFEWQGLHLKIVRAGQTALDAPTPPSCMGQTACGFAPAGVGLRPSLHVLDLDRDGEPEVVVDLFSGGAHCCWYGVIYKYAPASGTYSALENNFGEPYTLKDLNGDGIVELQGYDLRFDEAFTSHAASLQPITIFDFRAGMLVDVTRSFPTLIAKDARADLKIYKRFRGRRDQDVRGILAAWAADEYLLGRKKTANSVLSHALHRGELSRPGGGFPAGKRYVRRLRKLLAKYGYG
jgi:hypothetical protein